MSAPRLLLALLKWDLLRELRRKETVLNMTLFAVLLLFLVVLGIGALLRRSGDELRESRKVFEKIEKLERAGATEKAAAEERGQLLASLRKVVQKDLGSLVRPVFFWLIILFAGTVGLSQSFAAEREANTLTGVLLSPNEIGYFYLAKVAATWLYVMIMELILLGAFLLLLNISQWSQLGPLVVIMGVFTLGYVACGVLLAAMTTSLRAGGEVVLRILLYPLLIPLVSLTLRVKEATFGADLASATDSEPLAFLRYVGLALAFDAIYLSVGFLLFPKVFEE